MADQTTYDPVNPDKYKFDESYQQRVLSCILLDPKFVDEARQILNPKFFDYDDLSFISRIALDHYDKYNVVPNYEEIKSLVNQYGAGLSVAKDKILQTLHQCYHTNITSSQSIFDSVEIFGNKQRAKRGVIKLAMLVDDYESNEEEYLNILSSLGTKLTGKTSNEIISFKDTWQSLPDRIIEKTSDDSKGRLPLGINTLDIATGGGIDIGELWFMISDSGVGKSNSLINISSKCVQRRKRVLFITNEVKQESLEQRHGAVLTGIPIDDLHKIEYREHYNRVMSNVFNDDYLDIVYFPPYRMTIEIFKSIISKRMNMFNKKYDLIIIDAFYRLGGIDAHTGWIGEGEVCKKLITVISDFKLRCIVSDQPIKSVDTTKYINHHDMGGENDKFQDADFCISFNQFPEQRKNSQATYFISKARRSGEGAVVNVMYDRDKTLQIIDWNQWIQIQNDNIMENIKR